MIGLKDIKSLTAFKRNTREYIKMMKKGGNPLILTVNGKAELIVQDVASYQRIIETINRLEAVGVLREGMESVRQEKQCRSINLIRGCGRTSTQLKSSDRLLRRANR